MLNVGPTSLGVIPSVCQSNLLTVGRWLKVNGDAIYGTRAWTVYGEGPTKVQAGSFHDTDTVNYTAEDFRFTTKGSDLFAIELGWPAGNEAVVKTLSSAGRPEMRKIEAVHLLGSDASLQFTQAADGLHIQLPAKPADAPAYAFRISFGGGARP